LYSHISDCFLRVPAVIAEGHQELLTKVLLFVSGQYGTFFPGGQRPRGLGLCLHNLPNSVIFYGISCHNYKHSNVTFFNTVGNGLFLFLLPFEVVISG
jgi:hypothetical protein